MINKPTHEQMLLDKFLDATLSIINGSGSGGELELYLSKKLRRYPFASVVYTKVRDNKVYIVRADDRIEGIIGYTPDELAGKPLTFIMSEPLEYDKLNKTLTELRDYGSSIKTNINKCKDGSLIETFGVIEDMGEDMYREVVVDASKIIGNEVGNR